MGWTELLLIALGLSMDAFAAAVCKGLSSPAVRVRHALIAGAYFGLFQAVMPFIGYMLGRQFAPLMASFDHWIAFGLLSFLGIGMIREGLSPSQEATDGSFSPRVMLPLALATSIDALTAGVTFAFLQQPLAGILLSIGCTTFLLSAMGVWIGHSFGRRWRGHAELFGGTVLLLMGVKLLLEHLGII